MPETCVSRNLDVTAGVLGIEPWSVPRIVSDQTFNSIGDGVYGATTNLPGKLMVQGSLNWVNNSPLPATLLIRVTRAYRSWKVAQPNAVQIRDRWTWSIGGSATPPDPSSVMNGMCGAALDVSVNSSGTPLPGVYYEFEDASTTEEWAGDLPPGVAFDLRYACYLWTPPPWSDNANLGGPQYSAEVRNTRIQLFAFPTRDPEVS
jgi:hypothetical protein